MTSERRGKKEKSEKETCFHAHTMRHPTKGIVCLDCEKVLEPKQSGKAPSMEDVQEFLAIYIDVEPIDDYMMQGATLVF
jgi:hypothetical protein